MQGCEELYLSIDIDAMDAGYLPGTGSIVHSGITPRQYYDLLDGLAEAPLGGLDIVEVSPPLDPSERTEFSGGRNAVSDIAPLPNSIGDRAMMEYIGTRQLGGLSHAGQVLAPATRPWITDLAALCPYEGLQPGNIPEFERDPDWNNWVLTDSPKDPLKRMNWHVFQQGGTGYLVADRMLMTRVSWQDLDDAGYVFGTEVSIDGKQFRCRLLTGGDDAS